MQWLQNLFRPNKTLPTVKLSEDEKKTIKQLSECPGGWANIPIPK
jgi:hypothetical protein